MCKCINNNGSCDQYITIITLNCFLSPINVKSKFLQNYDFDNGYSLSTQSIEYSSVFTNIMNIPMNFSAQTI